MKVDGSELESNEMELEQEDGKVEEMEICREKIEKEKKVRKLLARKKKKKDFVEKSKNETTSIIKFLVKRAGSQKMETEDDESGEKRKLGAESNQFGDKLEGSSTKIFKIDHELENNILSLTKIGGNKVGLLQCDNH